MMRCKISTTIILLATLLPLWAFAQNNTVYKWVDEDGVVHYGDSIPPEYAEVDKHVVNDAGITVGLLHGKKTPEEIAEELRQEEIAVALELQRRNDSALLATYRNIDEIILHRDRRIELFQAQSRVTELYLRNIKRRLVSLMETGVNFRPYSTDPDAQMIDPGLAEDILDTRATITRHEANLDRFSRDEQEIVVRFDGDISRFKLLRGLD